VFSECLGDVERSEVRGSSGGELCGLVVRIFDLERLRYGA
jgi:hypothetical protein